MTLKESNLFFLREDCLRTFGEEKGDRLYRRTEERYQKLMGQTDDRGSVAVRSHLQSNLFPALSYYQILRDDGMDEEQALAHVRRETQRAAGIKRDRMKRLARIPFAYTVYRLAVKGYMRKNFPAEGWETRWVRRDAGEIHFDLHRCLYWEVTRQYGCPELCTVYCENDIIAFSGLMPGIRFERSGTLGQGAVCCDFHFIRSRRG